MDINNIYFKDSTEEITDKDINKRTRLNLKKVYVILFAIALLAQNIALIPR